MQVIWYSPGIEGFFVPLLLPSVWLKLRIYILISARIRGERSEGTKGGGAHPLSPLLPIVYKDRKNMIWKWLGVEELPNWWYLGVCVTCSYSN